jgi:hypothetical protein
VSPWLATAAAALLAVLPMQTSSVAPAPTAAESEDVQLRLANARIRFERALASHRYRRDDPDVIAIGRALTEDLLPLLAWRGEFRGDVVNTLGAIASDALGAYLATIDPRNEMALAIAYLRAHADASLVARLIGDSPVVAGALTPAADAIVELGRRGQASMAPVFASLLPVATRDRERICHASLFLPARARATVVDALVASLPPDPPDDVSAACVLLAVQSRAGRTLVARWIDRVDVASLPRVLSRWYLAAAVALANTEQHATAERAQRAVLGAGVPPFDAGDALAHYAPFLPLGAPAARAFVARISPLLPSDIRALGPARLRAHDATLASAAIDRLRAAAGDPQLLRMAMLLVGLGVADTPSTPVRARLLELREQLHATVGPRVDPREVDSWLDAIAAVDACHGAHACLASLVAHGAEHAAARAIFTLGARGLAALDEATATALVTRLAGPASVPLVSAFTLAVDGCPDRLRGATEARVVADDLFTPMRVFFSVFAATCEGSH